MDLSDDNQKAASPISALSNVALMLSPVLLQDLNAYSPMFVALLMVTVPVIFEHCPKARLPTVEIVLLPPSAVENTMVVLPPPMQAYFVNAAFFTSKHPITVKNHLHFLTFSLQPLA